MSQSLADQLAATALSGGNAGFIEDLYEKFLQDPASVDPAWAKYFGHLAGTSTREIPHGEVRERLLTRQERPPAPPPVRRDGPPAACDVASATHGAAPRLTQG